MTNAYFEEFTRIGGEWEKRKEGEFPFSQGAWKAYNAWRRSKEASTTGEILFDDFVWEDEVHDFIDTLRKAGIETFVVTSRSSSLMENLHWFASEGCTMQGLCTVRVRGYGGEVEEKGIRMGVG